VSPILDVVPDLPPVQPNAVDGPGAYRSCQYAQPGYGNIVVTVYAAATFRLSNLPTASLYRPIPGLGDEALLKAGAGDADLFVRRGRVWLLIQVFWTGTDTTPSNRPSAVTTAIALARTALSRL